MLIMSRFFISPIHKLVFSVILVNNSLRLSVGNSGTLLLLITGV